MPRAARLYKPRLALSLPDLLQQPGVAIRIVELGEAGVRLVLRIWSGYTARRSCPEALSVEHLADIGATGDKDFCSKLAQAARTADHESSRPSVRCPIDSGGDFRKRHLVYRRWANECLDCAFKHCAFYIHANQPESRIGLLDGIAHRMRRLTANTG